MNFDQELDVCGLLCPIPVLKTKVAMDKMPPGLVLKVISTDAGSARDMQAFANTTGNRLLHSTTDGDNHIFYLRKNGDNTQ